MQGKEKSMLLQGKTLQGQTIRFDHTRIRNYIPATDELCVEGQAGREVVGNESVVPVLAEVMPPDGTGFVCEWCRARRLHEEDEGDEEESPTSNERSALLLVTSVAWLAKGVFWSARQSLAWLAAVVACLVAMPVLRTAFADPTLTQTQIFLLRWKEITGLVLCLLVFLALSWRSPEVE